MTERSRCEATRQQQICDAWHEFVARGTTPSPFVASHILKGWKLSRKHNVDPKGELVPPMLSAEALSALRAEHAVLLNASEPMLNMLEVSIRDSGYIATLAVASGHLLSVVGNQKQLKRAMEHYNLPGANRSIKYVGASALTLSIDEGKPVQVTGYEHYNHYLHDWRCAAAPIFDAEGVPIASLTLSGHISYKEIHLLMLVSACADAITIRLREESLLESQRRLNALLESIHNALPEPVIAINSENVITHANNTALEHFCGSGQTLVGNRFDTLIGTPDLPRVRRVLEKGLFETMELEVRSKAGLANHLCRFAPILLDDGTPCGATFTISARRHLIDIAKHVSGNYAKYSFDDIKGESHKLKDQIELAKRAAVVSSRILISGESGTGKELFAQSIHNYSPTRAGPFVAISCAAIPRDLIESELFGYVGGAFTGARRNGMIGKMELATGGTLFLDEINSLPFELQGKLLRAIQQMEIVRIGDTKPTRIDIRVISATNQDLRASVRDGLFREDLYFRLSALEISVPPLRERSDDIALLVHFFLRRFSADTGISFHHISTGALEALYNYAWPGNIRELENACERALLMSQDGKVETRHLPAHLLSPHRDDAPADLGVSTRVHDTYRMLVISALQKEQGNISKAAEHLGIARTTLYRKLRQYNIRLK